MAKESNIGLFFAYDSKDDTKNSTGFSYKTSNALIGNVIAKKETGLFSQLVEDGETLAVTSSSTECVDKKGKRVNLTPFQLKLTTALAQIVDSVVDDNSEYIKKLPNKIEDRESDGNSYKKLPNPVKCVIDIPQLTKAIYSKNRVGGKQTDKVKEELKKISELNQKYKFEDSRGGTLTIEAPLITLGKKVTYETKEGKVTFNKVEVTFEDVFVYEIKDRFSLSPITLLSLWNETGVNTELYTILLFLLISVRGRKVKDTSIAVNNERKELKKNKLDEATIQKKLQELKRAKLTYKESIPSIMERLSDRATYLDKGTYLRKSKLRKDLDQAKNALLQVGIITEYYETTGATGDTICNFVINDKWLENEANRVKGMLDLK